MKKNQHFLPDKYSTVVNSVPEPEPEPRTGWHTVQREKIMQGWEWSGKVAFKLAVTECLLQARHIARC